MVKKKKQLDNPEKYRCFKVPITAILHKDTNIAQRNMLFHELTKSLLNRICYYDYGFYKNIIMILLFLKLQRILFLWR